jgi:SAM-dependent methyltransferase
MGLGRAAIKLIAETVRDCKLGGRVLVIGKQEIWGTGEEVRRWLEESGLSPVACEMQLALKPDFRRLQFIQDTSVFKLMGFREVVNLDNSDYEGAEVVWDLNRPLAEELLVKAGRFDLIIDSGCLEHIFNVPEVLKNFYRLAGDNGVVVHILPSNNLVDHGFYMFSPTLFQDYYGANRWRVLCNYFFQHYPNYKSLWKIYKYKPGALSAFAFTGMMSRSMCSTYFASQKQPGATCDANVQQGMYLTAWSKKVGSDSVPKSAWLSFRERLKPYVPELLIPYLLALESRIQKIGGIARYLEHYKNL